jgi:ABC-2 type transport system permease protein
MKPGSTLWLLHQELRLTWRTWWDATRTKGWGRVAFYAVTVLVLLAFGFWIASFISRLQPAPTFASLGAVSAAFLVVATLMLSQALVLITDALYQRGDMDLLLASPLPPWRILVVRMAAIAVNVAAFYLALSLAVFLFLPLFGGWSWMGFAPTVAALALAVTGLGVFVARLLFKLVGPKNTRVFAQILAAFTGAAIFLALQFGNLSRMDEDEGPQTRADALNAWLARMEAEIDLASPIFIPARAALGEPLPLALWIAFAILFYLLAVRWFAARFERDAAAVAGAARKGRRRQARAFRSGLTRSLLRKEWRLIARDPLLISQVLLPLLYFAPLVYVMARDIGDGEITRAALATSAGALVFISSMLAHGLVWLTVSAEDAPDLIAAAPVDRPRVERAKALAASLPLIALNLAPMIAAAFVSAPAALWLAAGLVLSIVSTTLIGIWHQQPGKRRDFRTRARARVSLAANFGQFFVTLSWAIATALTVAGGIAALLAIIPALIALGLMLALHESRIADPQAAAEAYEREKAEKQAKRVEKRAMREARRNRQTAPAATQV